MNILGDFLVTDVGYRHEPFQAWAWDRNSANASGTLTTLQKDENYIILADIYPKNNRPAQLKMEIRQFSHILTEWEEKVCKLQPQSVIISYNDDEFVVETNNSVELETTNQENITHFPLVPHKYPFWIKTGSTICFILFFRCLSQFPYYFQLSAQIKKAHREFKCENYNQAATCFSRIHKELPTNQYISRYLAHSLFKSEYFGDHLEALEILSNIKLKRKDWNELLKYMPAEYTSYFNTSLGFR